MKAFFAKLSAFTLAETLVVMGIIGVVAALTIPNLNQSTGDREKVAKVKKIYANLEDAYGRATAVYGPYDEWFNDIDNDIKTQTKRVAERMIEFMKVSKICGLGEKGCFSSSIPTDLDGEEFENSYDDVIGYKVILADGTSLLFNGYNDILKIRVDIDGPNKGKNQYGSDIFDFTMFTVETDYAVRVGGSTPFQLYPSCCPNSWTGNLAESYISNYATAWIVRNGNMDYLKCPDELNWDTKTSCK